MRRHAVPAAATAFAAAVACGCSTFYPVHVERTAATAGRPKPATQVEVLAETPSRPFVEIARLTTDSANYDSPGHAVERLRSVAAEKGADAIIVERRGSHLASAGTMGLGSAIDFGNAPTSGDPAFSSGGASVASFARVIAIRWATPDGGKNEVGEAAEPSSRPSRPEDAPFFKPATSPKPNG